MPQLYCPHCRTPPLEACSHTGHLVDVCPRCGGLWCEPSGWDREKLGPLPNYSQREEVLFGPGAAHKPPEVEVGVRPRRPCPRGHGALTALVVGGADGCEIDQCDHCGGVWLDHGEWDHLAALRQLEKEHHEIDRPTTWGEWAFQFFLRLPVEFNIEPRRFPVVAFSLICMCLGIGVWQLTVGVEAWAQLALVPEQVRGGGRWWTLLTSMFLHADGLHLAANLYFLYILGDNVEDVLGHARFLLFYLACGLAGGLLTVVFNPHGEVAVVGASGAIAGVMAAYLLLFRQARLTVMLLVFQFKVPALIWIGVWFGLQLGGALLDPTSAASGIAWMAHVGGFLAGLLIIWPMEESLLRQHPLLRVLRTYRPPPAAARLHEPNPSKMRYR